MSITVKALLVFVIVFHLLAFVVEAFLWMNPLVHSFVLNKQNISVDVELYDQALILKVLFINQGFYNLMLAIGGILGFVLIFKGKESEGQLLLGYMCVFASVAALVLLVTAKAYVGAILQGLPATIAMFMLYPTLMQKSR